MGTAAASAASSAAVLAATFLAPPPKKEVEVTLSCCSDCGPEKTRGLEHESTNESSLESQKEHVLCPFGREKDVPEAVRLARR